MNLSPVCIALVLFTLNGATVRLAAQPSLPPSPVPGATGEIAARSPEAGGGPLIQFDQKEYNWGKVEAGEFVKHIFNVTNTGTQMLLITNVRPSCGCTTAGNWTTNIAPGQAGTIPIQFNSTRFSGPAPITKTIEVYSNAKDHPRETLYLRGLVRKTIEFNPPTPVINLVADATNSASTTVTITCQSDQPITISEPVSSSKSFTADLQTTTPGKEYKLVVTALPPFSPGSTSATINLKSTLASTPALSLNVIAYVQAEIQVSPPQLRLGTLPNVWTTNHSVIIRGNSATPLTLSGAESSDPKIHAEISPIGVAGMYNLQVALPPNYRIEPGQTVVISIKSNNPRNPVVKVPLIQTPHGVPVIAPSYSGLHGAPAGPQAAGHP